MVTRPLQRPGQAGEWGGICPRPKCKKGSVQNITIPGGAALIQTPSGTFRPSPRANGSLAAKPRKPRPHTFLETPSPPARSFYIDNGPWAAHPFVVKPWRVGADSSGAETSLPDVFSSTPRRAEGMAVQLTHVHGASTGAQALGYSHDSSCFSCLLALLLCFGT